MTLRASLHQRGTRCHTEFVQSGETPSPASTPINANDYDTAKRKRIGDPAPLEHHQTGTLTDACSSKSDARLCSRGAVSVAATFPHAIATSPMSCSGSGLDVKGIVDAVDAAYFEKYDSAFVHEEMLRDTVRCKAYADAITSCSSVIAGGVVIDVGAGSGILSCLCARAGARKVYAIEASASAACLCRDVVCANACDDIVEVLEARLEDVELPAETKADVIVSEWMGYFLFYESMLDSVILARDRWLRPGGILLPSRARLLLCPFSDAHWRRCRDDWLSDVCGLDVSVLSSRLATEEACEPVIQGLDPSQLLSEPQCVSELNLSTVQGRDVSEQRACCRWRVATSSASSIVQLHGFAGWFEVLFDPPAWSPSQLLTALPLSSRFAPAGASGVENVTCEGSADLSDKLLATDVAFPKRRVMILSTAPNDPRTCWHQTLFYLPPALRSEWRGEDKSSNELQTLKQQPTHLTLERDTVLVGEIVLSRPLQNKRFLNVSIRYHVTNDGADFGSLPIVKAGADPTKTGGISKTTMMHHSWTLRSYAREGTRAPPLPVAKVRGTSRAACYGGAC